MSEDAADAGREERGRLAWMLALGVLDPAPDPALDAVAEVAAGAGGGKVGVFLTAEGRPALVAGEEPAAASSRAPVVVEGLTVGEVRGPGPGRVLAAAAASVARLLAARLARRRRDDRGRPVAVVVLDAEGVMLWASPEFEPLLGWPAAERVGTSALSLLAPQTAELSAGIFAQVARSPGRGGFLTHHLTLSSGEPVPFEIQSDNRLADPHVGGIALVIRCCPDAESEGTILGDQIWVLNRLSAGVPLGEVLGRVVELSERRDPRSHACVMRLGEDGTRLDPLVAPRLPPEVVAALRALPVGPRSLAGGSTVHFGLPRFESRWPEDVDDPERLQVIERHGYRACWSLPIPSMEGAGQLGSLDVYRLVSAVPAEEETRVLILAARLCAIAMEHESKTRRLRFDATHDPLTGLANRVHFAERLESARERELGVLFIDLDRFKLVNDTLGHAFGDEVLRAVAARLSEEVEEPGVVARFGGDEFTILLPESSSLDEVVVRGERLLAAVSRPYLVHGQLVTIGASAGATFSVDARRDAGSLVRDADTALYHAKERGRGRVEAFDARLLSALASRVEVERALRAALECGGITVEFQPEVHIESGRATGVEALARCRATSGQPIPPSTFVPVAEEVGLISRVFEEVLAHACAAAADWNRSAAAPLVVWVNLAPQQLGSPSLVEQVERVVGRAGAAPETLGFEVTERGILPDPLEAARRLGELAALGVRLAVDDFGTGHSSLGHLQHLPVDTVKLDRSFVAGAADDLRARAIVRAVVELATAIGLHCIAEGVENPRQLDVIRELGCEVAQGFVYCRPAPAPAVTDWMSRAHHPAGVHPVPGGTGSG